MRGRSCYLLALFLLLGFLSIFSTPAAETMRPHESESFEKGLEKGRSIREQILRNPGARIFGPAVGEREFRTFADNPADGITFSASVLGDHAYAEFNRVRICIIGATENGLELRIETASHIHNPIVHLIGDNGFAIKSDNNPDWLSPGTSYYFWLYNSGTGDVYPDEGAAHAAATNLGVSLYEALGSPMCVAPSRCPGLEVNTVILNFNLILSKLGQGILRRIHETDQNVVVSNYSGETSSNCIAYSILRPTDEGDPNALRCWIGPKGTLPTCESIRALEERGKNFNKGISQSVLSPGEALILSGREARTPFYKDEETGFEIKSPYALIKERTEGTAYSGGGGHVEVKNCQVENHPWGSTTTGWVNNIEGILCEQGDWECIRRAVSQKCGTFELDRHCTLMEEIVDGIPSIQFGRETGLALVAGSGPTGGVSIRCWYFLPNYQLTPEEQNDYIAFFNSYAPEWVKNDPRFDPAAEDSMKLLKGENNWLTCGDFQTITRKYYCRNDEEMCPDGHGGYIPCWDQARLEASIEKSLGISNSPESIYDPSTDTLTGTFNYLGSGWVTESLPLSETPGFMQSEISECPDAEKTCLIAWCGDERIVAGSNGGLPPTECSHLRKEVRQCEKDKNTGELFCPLSPEEESAGAWIMADCSCRSFLGEAVGYLAMLRTISHDIKCGDSYTDSTTDELKNFEKEVYQVCEDDSDKLLKAIYICGTQKTASEEAEWLVCQPKPEQRPEPFSPIAAILWTTNDYRCLMTHYYEGKWKYTMDFGFMNVYPKWFDYCVDTYKDAVRTYLTEGVELNKDLPPDNLCNPSLGHTNNYSQSRPLGCGYDPWTITGGPSRSNIGVGLHPDSEYPFGYVTLGYSLFREYDCYKTGLDCNSDNWLDFFNCNWRSEGWDCNRDCIRDNNYHYCNRISGWDCHKTDGCDRFEYEKCEYRLEGYDYDDDCKMESTSSRACSNLWFVPSSKRVTRDCGRTPCSQCTGCSAKSTYNCDPYSCNCHSVCDAYNVHYTYTCSDNSTGSGDICADQSLINQYCGKTVGDCTYSCSIGSCCRSHTECSTCYHTCYICYDKIAGVHVEEGYYCGSSSQNNCSLSGPKDCKFVYGYDCGRNGGSDGNQSPDGCIDNNYHYCCHVAQGWDCSGAEAPTAYIQNIRANLSNDRIIAGHCNIISNLADSECGIYMGSRKQYRCSRTDHPGQCCSETKIYNIRIRIENTDFKNAGNYHCRALDEHFSPPVEVDRKYNDEGIVLYDNPATEVNDEARFLTEGCRDKYNNIYFDPGTGTPLGTLDKNPIDPSFYEGFIPSSISWKYIAYEDFIRHAAEEQCEWRDYIQKCYCTDLGDGPAVMSEHINRFIFYEDMSDFEIEH